MKKNNGDKRINLVIACIILILIGIFTSNDININAFSNITNSISNISNEVVKSVNEIGLNLNKNDNQQENIQVFEEDLKVCFIDVGQADSILVMNKNESMLIDAGNNDDGKIVVDFLKDKGISKINYLVGTHPHEDHIGGLDDVINEFEIGKILMPDLKVSTVTYKDVEKAMKKKNLELSVPKKGDVFKVGDSSCEIMTSPIIDRTNLNLSSIVINLEYGNNSFLFMADAEEANERSRNWNKVDVLKVGHHGSTTSTTAKFLSEIKPKIAIISVGKNNDYGHPKDIILRKLEKIGAKIYRTDKNGSIEVISNGQEIKVNIEK